MRENPKIKRKFGETKFWKADQIRKYFVNCNIENEVFR